jgi:hypothetical protein
MLEGSPGALDAHPGATEFQHKHQDAYSRLVRAHNRIFEAHHGAIEDPVTIEAQHGAALGPWRLIL